MKCVTVPHASDGALTDILSAGVNPLGYDFSVGEHVYRVTAGKQETLTKGGEGIVIYPGETILAKTLERVCLPPEVFALGAPKMSLLSRGLWAHGGKTDFGYKSQLVLGFTNLGGTPIPMKHGDRIFHLSFYKVPDRPQRDAYSGSLHWPQQQTESLLEGGFTAPIDKDVQKRILERDGMNPYRLAMTLWQRERALKRRSWIQAVWLGLLTLVLLAKMLSDAGIIAVPYPLPVLETVRTLGAVLIPILLVIIPVWWRKKRADEKAAHAPKIWDDQEIRARRKQDE